MFEFSIEGQPAAKKFRLSEGTAGVGRDPTNALHLDDPRVSRFHARLTVIEEGCFLTDLGSANGTRVNGEELEPRAERKLRDGDRIELGPFVLHCSIVPSDTQAPSSEQVVVTTGLAACLRVVTPEGTTEHVLVGDELTLGRDPTNDIVVEADTVSRRHASLVRRDGEWEIIDLGSTNGLQSPAGQRIERAVLREGERLLIGQSVELQFSRGMPSAPSAPSLAPRGLAAGPTFRPRPPTREIDLPRDAPLVLGRDEQADLVLAHPQVSKAHARITMRGGRYVVEDLGSTSGTYVNGQPVRERPLREGDEVRVGSSRLILRENRLQVLDEAGNLRLDAFHLSREVGKGRVILSDVSLSILPREFVAIVGGSGSGKTTLLNALCGFQPATTGRVFLNGIDLYQSFSAYRNELGYVPQDDIIHRDLPVMRALNYAAALRMPRDTSEFERRQRVQEVLHQLDIHSCWDRPVKQLSGGQRKRVSMGVELLTRPSLFFLDEATSGLDPGTEAQLMRLLRRLADEGRTVVLVTHATKNVMMCDKVVFLARGGHLAYFGGPEEALRYFGVDDFDEIYTRLEEGQALAWGQRFRSSPLFKENVEARLATALPVAVSHPQEPDSPAAAVSPRAVGAVFPQAAARAVSPPAAAALPRGPAPSRRGVSALQQFLVLSRRQLDTIWSDKKTALLLLALAPLLGVLDFLIWRRDMFDPRTGSATQAVMMFFITAIITILIGTITSVREIVKEDAIYRRERMVGLQVLPFVGSKAAVGFLFAVYSSVMLFVFMIAAVDFSHLTAAQTLSLLVPLILGTFAGVMWGLLVSALAPTEDRAMLLVIAVLIPQFVFSGGVIPIKNIGFAGTVLGWLTSARWELGAIVTSARVTGGSGLGGALELESLSLPGLQSLGSLSDRQGLVTSLRDQYGDIFNVNVGFYWLMSLLLSLALFMLVLLLQKRKDRL